MTSSTGKLNLASSAARQFQAAVFEKIKEVWDADLKDTAVAEYTSALAIRGLDKKAEASLINLFGDDTASILYPWLVRHTLRYKDDLLLQEAARKAGSSKTIGTDVQEASDLKPTTAPSEMDTAACPTPVVAEHPLLDANTGAHADYVMDDDVGVSGACLATAEPVPREQQQSAQLACGRSEERPGSRRTEEDDRRSSRVHDSRLGHDRRDQGQGRRDDWQRDGGDRRHSSMHRDSVQGRDWYRGKRDWSSRDCDVRRIPAGRDDHSRRLEQECERDRCRHGTERRSSPSRRTAGDRPDRRQEVQTPHQRSPSREAEGNGRSAQPMSLELSPGDPLSPRSRVRSAVVVTQEAMKPSAASLLFRNALKGSRTAGSVPAGDKGRHLGPLDQSDEPTSVGGRNSSLPEPKEVPEEVPAEVPALMHPSFGRMGEADPGDPRQSSVFSRIAGLKRPASAPGEDERPEATNGARVEDAPSAMKQPRLAAVPDGRGGRGRGPGPGPIRGRGSGIGPGAHGGAAAAGGRGLGPGPKKQHAAVCAAAAAPAPAAMVPAAAAFVRAGAAPTAGVPPRSRPSSYAAPSTDATALIREMTARVAMLQAEIAATVTVAEQRSVLVQQLPPAATELELKAFFRLCGQPSSIDILKDTASGLPTGTAHVVFDNEKSFMSAIQLNGSNLYSASGSCCTPVTVVRKCEPPLPLKIASDPLRPPQATSAPLRPMKAASAAGQGQLLRANSISTKAAGAVPKAEDSSTKKFVWRRPQPGALSTGTGTSS